MGNPGRNPGTRNGSHVETSSIQFGKTAIAYTIDRGRREKTVAIAVDPLEGVRVRAPRDTAVEKLDDIVRRKARWIIERRRRVEDLAPPVLENLVAEAPA